MSSVSIFEKKWCDFVFEGKNKEYGAYQLRKESSRTTLVAFCSGIIFLSLLVVALSSFASKNDVIVDDFNPDTAIKVDIYYPPKNDETKLKLPAAKKAKEKSEIKKEDLKNLVVAKQDEKFVDVKTIDEAKKSANTTEHGLIGGKGTDNEPFDSSKGNAGSSTILEIAKPKEPIITALLDKKPEFPGGINKFYEYVGNNFEKPEMDENENVSVYVSFVIEIDGTITDVKVLRNPGYGLGKEAIRVLQSLKTKWKPGIKDGQPVRTQFTLPITVKKG